MNRENLKLMANHIRKIPQELFDMRIFREGQLITPKCNSAGCAVGHCTVLDPNPDGIPRFGDGEINFVKWSEIFTSLNDYQWNWCFSWDWRLRDNTPEGAALRIEWLLKKGLPRNWKSQMIGKAPLCYRNKNTTMRDTIAVCLFYLECAIKAVIDTVLRR